MFWKQNVEAAHIALSKPKRCQANIFTVNKFKDARFIKITIISLAIKIPKKIENSIDNIDCTSSTFLLNKISKGNMIIRRIITTTNINFFFYGEI